jgi:hypothetical protein
MTNPTIDLLAATFRRLSVWRAAHLQDAQRWRDAAARSFADVAMALEAGLPPNEVAVVCFAAAEAFAEPDRAYEVRERSKRKLEETP